MMEASELTTPGGAEMTCQVCVCVCVCVCVFVCVCVC
eukprot:COSAG03_NODE_35226_length_119_cov_2457.400000_1_plen_36_part_01